MDLDIGGRGGSSPLRGDRILYDFDDVFLSDIARNSKSTVRSGFKALHQSSREQTAVLPSLDFVPLIYDIIKRARGPYHEIFVMTFNAYGPNET